MAYKRVMLKLSGEVLGGADGVGADPEAVMAIAKELKKLVKSKIQLAIVVGGGNFWRFRDNKTLPLHRTDSDAVGMMASVMNACVLKGALEHLKVKAHVLAPHITFYNGEPYAPARGRELLARGEVVICGGGTGNPFFTTDTTAALRALELDCEVLLKATKVDGVYSADPMKNKKAKFFKEISYDEVLKRELGVMDLNSIVLCKENGLPLRVFSLQKSGNLLKAVKSKSIGSLIH